MFKLIISVVTISSFCLADSAVMYEFPDGRTVAMISNGDITMAAESVSIVPAGSLFEEYDGYGWLPMMKVSCRFELVNNSDEEQYITVGFPFDAKFGDSYSALGGEMLVEELSRVYNDDSVPSWQEINPAQSTDAEQDLPEELDFRTLINGEETQVYYRRCARNSEESLIWRPVVAVWKMRFDPRETVILENTYNTSWDFQGSEEWGEFTANYILVSGATWSGPIGDAVLTLELPPELPLPALGDSMVVYWEWSGSPEISNRTVVWHYTDLEPEENIDLTVVTGRRYYWGESVNTTEMYNAIEWTEDEILPSASRYLHIVNMWGPVYNTELVVSLLEALPYLAEGHTPPDGYSYGLFSTEELDHETDIPKDHIAALHIVETVKAGVERDIAVVNESGYMEFLPLFCGKISWDSQILGRYSSFPEKQEMFLNLLENLEPASQGREIEDPVVSAFYRLTGWYYPGTTAWIQSITPETVRRYREANFL